MRKLSQSELESTHRIFNHVDEIVNYYGHKTIDETALFVSTNRWIMFPVRGIESLREGTNLPVPNVFVGKGDPEENIDDDGNGRMTGWIGLTFHNSAAMSHLDYILKRPRTKGTVFLRCVQGLSDDWSVDVTHKIKTGYEKSTPHYKVFRSLIPSKSSLDSIHQALIDSDQSLPGLGDVFEDNGLGINGRITVFSLEKETNPGSFDRDVKEIFDIFLRMIELGQAGACFSGMA